MLTIPLIVERTVHFTNRNMFHKQRNQTLTNIIEIKHFRKIKLNLDLNIKIREWIGLYGWIKCRHHNICKYDKKCQKRAEKIDRIG